ncbi:MAG: hypothetical protein WCL61_00250 [bacterium]
MDEKRGNLFKVIIEEYIKSATPVGSSLIVEKYLPDVSSATVRNYMAELEAEALLMQPHTSAGRIPTVAGYEYYLANFIGEGQLSAKSKKILEEALKSLSIKDREQIKTLAKLIAELSDATVLIGFGPMDVYYTGVANLFKQPEFLEQGSVYSMSAVIDHLDEVMAKIFYQIEDDVKVLIGDSNPFGSMSSVVVSKCHGLSNDLLVGILGPSRMDYRSNLGLLNYLKQYFNQK